MKVNPRKIVRYFLIALIVACCAYILRPGFIKYAERRGEVNRLEAEIEQLGAERAGLEEHMQKLEQEDPELIERLAREKLHLSKPGETVFRFKNKE